MSEGFRRLPDAELEVMQALWSLPAPATRGQISEIVCAGRPMAQTTLLTLLSRLGEKGFLRAEKQGRQSVYTPLVSRQDYLAAQGRRFFKTLCGGSLSAFATALCDSGLSREELAELRALLEEDRL